MNVLTVEPNLGTRLQGLNERTLVCGEDGTPLGLFVPTAVCGPQPSESVEIPFSDEEIARLRGGTGGGPLAEFWKRVGRE